MPAPRTLRCFLVGEGTLLVQCAELLLQRGHTLLGIVSGEPAIVRWAEAKGIAHQAPEADPLPFLGRAEFDWLFSIANLALLPQAVLALPKSGTINFHDGPLPRYAGLRATSWAILAGESQHGITWHEIAGKVDAGRILKQRLFELAPGETAFTLNARCYQEALPAFAELIDELAAETNRPLAQDPAQRSWFGKHKRPEAACALRFERSAAQLGALARALDFGPYANPLGTPKLALPDGSLVLVGALSVREPQGAASALAAGEIGSAQDGSLLVGCASGAVELSDLRELDGAPLEFAAFVKRHALAPGLHVPLLGDARAQAWTQGYEQLARSEDAWTKRLLELAPYELPYAHASSSTATGAGAIALGLAELAPLEALPLAERAQHLLAAFAAFLARIGESSVFDVGWSEPRLTELARASGGLASERVPLRIALELEQGFAAACTGLAAELARSRELGSYARDLYLRTPALGRNGERRAPELPVLLRLASAGSSASPAELVQACALAFEVDEGAAAARLAWSNAALARADAEALARQFATFLAALASDPHASLARVPLVSAAEQRLLLGDWNATALSVEPHCIHELFEAQVERTPHACALVFHEQELSYAELNARANALAHTLRELGVGPDVLVALCVERSLEMAVGLLAILKAGGAYVPLDPTYPQERLALMLEDAGARVLLTQAALEPRLSAHAARRVLVDAQPVPPAGAPQLANPRSGVRPEHLAYVIFTSGSTGRPKGVMVEHRNAVNFFAGMDQRIGVDAPGTWLAVTSISFDISVLELFWTLARGFRVVIHRDEERVPASAAAPGAEEASAAACAIGASFGAARDAARDATARPRRALDFSLFYFASDQGEDPSDKYRLLREGALFADQRGFKAVWTPERHFHAFGGLYPNPSVAAAAIAAMTRRIGIRAGSVVLPLHSPIRVAEEWSLVDNLSGGRVGISFAAGWQANDFALRPEAYADRKNGMFRAIETVQRLWRGEAVSFPNGEGQPTEVRTLPRPIQPELPTWVTAAGNPETFRMAGEAGANLLTHLLGQKLEELADKVRIYREARAKAGHAGPGVVTLMLHTFIGRSLDEVREIVRGPFSNYLRTSVDLIKNSPYSFPTFKAPSAAIASKVERGLKDFAAEELEALLEFAFERYFETSGLFGSVEDGLATVARVEQAGVDEIACLIDFGVAPAHVLASLEQLDELRRMSQPQAAEQDHSVAGALQRHGVTHLQCTPSLARMLALDGRAQGALRSLERLLVGGEALPPALADQLCALVRGEVHNMYGPTETAVWSTSDKLAGAGAPISIGRPIANTQLHVVDRHGGLVPPGVAGELWIGGAGVVRGYWQRADLTAERFVPDRFGGAPGARLYRTGDLVRRMADGRLEFLGRLDHQVKIRGFRIELGEIEAVLAASSGVREAVVLAREDTPGDKRLVAYVVPQPGRTLALAELRASLAARLPEFMVPAAFVMLDALPLTPNGKVNRRALPAPDRARKSSESSYAPPGGALEQTIAAIWQEALQLERVGANDNFFDLGAHSLMMVEVNAKLREALQREISIIQMFRHPTVAQLARALGAAAEEKPTHAQRQERADQRKEALARRAQLRQGLRGGN
jgi:natural product biosynthesis luciferase-like monooxygenase protein